MRTPSQLFSLLLATMLVGCASSPTQPSRAFSDAPVVVIYQYSDYPTAGHGSKFPGGLVAALWRDGRMIRPASPDAVGKSYVGGVVSPAERGAFLAFLGSSPALRVPEGGGIPVDAASQSITVRRDATTSKWTRVLPDTQSAWREVEARLLGLPLEDAGAVDCRVAEKLR